MLGFLLEFPRGCLGTNTFWRLFGLLLLFAILGDSFTRIPPCFPLLRFTLIVSFARNSVFLRRGCTVLIISWRTPSHNLPWYYVQNIPHRTEWSRAFDLEYMIHTPCSDRGVIPPLPNPTLLDSSREEHILTVTSISPITCLRMGPGKACGRAAHSLCWYRPLREQIRKVQIFPLL